MCRAIEHGGRRCPACTNGALRSAKRYAHRGRLSAADTGQDSYDLITAAAEAPRFDADALKAVADQITDAMSEHSSANAALTAIEERFGSVEGAVVWVGTQIAAEAEARAGIDLDAERAALTEEVEAAKAHIKADRERDRIARIEQDAVIQRSTSQEERAALLASQRGYWNRSPDDKTEQALTRLREGWSERSQQVHRALADAYRDVLAEIRPLGGELGWSTKTAKPAKVAFGEVTENYPTDWVNAASKGTQPLGRISRTRAHYARSRIVITRKRKQDTARSDVTLSNVDQWAEGNSYRRPAGDEIARVRAQLAETPGATVSAQSLTWESRRYSPTSEPPGRGWTLRETPWGTEWERPHTRLQAVEMSSSPELTTNSAPVRVAGVSPHYSTATHELAHRFEHTVPSIAALEKDFLTRRAAGEQLTIIRPGEYGYTDNLPVHYAGRVYVKNGGTRATDTGQHYEVLSCGTQALFGGDYGGLVGLQQGLSTFSRDEDYRAFVLGTLASVGRART